MPALNLATVDVTYDSDDPAPFHAGMARLGRAVSSKRTGISVYELPPGQAICPYHYECGEEEWLLVVAGHPTLRTPDGTRRLEPWDVAFFPIGPDGAHGVRNETEETVRVAMFSDVVVPTVSVYPDSDKVGVWTADKADNGLFRRASAVEYYDGEA